MPPESSLEVLPIEVSRGGKALQALSEAIVDGRLAPGSLHSVQGLASQLGVSRTPVREALLQLARDGSVRFERNRGVRILQTSRHDLEEIFEIREWLEVPATRQAVQRMRSVDVRALRRSYDAMLRAGQASDAAELWHHDRSFHKKILQASGNNRVAQFIDGLRDLVLRRDATTVGRERTACEIAEEHRPILDAIEAGDADGAAEAMRRHIKTTAQLLVSIDDSSGSVIENDARR